MPKRSKVLVLLALILIVAIPSAILIKDGIVISGTYCQHNTIADIHMDGAKDAFYSPTVPVPGGLEIGNIYTYFNHYPQNGERVVFFELQIARPWTDTPVFLSVVIGNNKFGSCSQNQ